MKEIARRINFFATAFTSILGFTLAYEAFAEDDMADKIDDILMFWLGVGAIWWYKKRGHKLDSAVGSIVIVGLGLVFKIMAIIIEHGDKEALGDDIGIAISLILAFIFVVWQFFRSKRVKS